MQSMYTGLEEAADELRRRRMDPGLVRRVEARLSDDIPCRLKHYPCAVLFRHLITPDQELRRFVSYAARANLPPLGLQYSADIFMSRNRDKAKLGKLCFASPKNGGGWQFEYLRAFDFAKAERKPIAELKTNGGRPLADFHAALVHHSFPEVHLCDASEWVQANGQRAQEYYRNFFLLFLAHGILFESFLEDEDEGVFTREVVRPAYAEVVAEFGLRPLVVELIRPEEWQDKFWWSYPAELKSRAQELLGEANFKN